MLDLELIDHAEKWQHEPDGFPQLKAYLQNKASIAKEAFLKWDFNQKLLMKDPGILMQIISFYNDLILFPSDEIFVKYQAIGIDRSFLTRFVELNKLEKEFEALTLNYPITVNTVGSLVQIKMYLQVKIILDIFFWISRTGNSAIRKRLRNVDKSLDNAIKRHEYWNGNVPEYANEFKRIVHETFGLQQTLHEVPNGARHFKQALKNIERTALRPLFQKGIQYDKVSMTHKKYCEAIAPLIRLIARDFSLETEDQFYQTKHEQGAYRNDHGRYLVRQMKKIL